MLHRQMGLNSLPVAFGVDTAKYICVGSIDVTQLGVAAYLAFGGYDIFTCVAKTVHVNYGQTFRSLRPCV